MLQKCFFKHFKLSLTVRDKSIVEIKKFAHCTQSKEYVIIGNCYELKEDFFKTPCRSSSLDIYLAKNLSALRYWALSDVNKKMCENAL